MTGLLMLFVKIVRMIVLGIWDILSWVWHVIGWLLLKSEERREHKTVKAKKDPEMKSEDYKPKKRPFPFPQKKKESGLVIILFLTMLTCTVCKPERDNVQENGSTASNSFISPSQKNLKSQRFQPFSFSAGDTVETVVAGPGKNYLLVSNKPYRAISVQKDGTEKVYDLPIGRTIWEGAEPEGSIKLIGIENETLVKIYPR